jgi:type IV pilus assembly protein PilM
MDFSLFSNNKRVINLIISDHSIRFLELKNTNVQNVHRWGEHILPDGIIREGKIIDRVTLSMILEECFGNWKIQKRLVKFLIPDPLVIIRKLKIPKEINEDEIKGYLYLELGTSIHLPFEEPVFDIFILSKDLDATEILLFAAPEKQVMEYASLLTELRLKPIAAEISPLAIYRLYDHLDMAKSEESLMVVQFDIDRVNISMFENQAPIFMHYIPLEFNTITWDIKRNEEENRYEIKFIGDAGELASTFEEYFKEISKLMDFYRYSIHQGSKSISKILLNGDHPLMEIILSEFASRFEVPVQTITLQESNVGKTGKVPMAQYLALGLALKEV